LDKLNLQIDLGEITRAEFFKGLEKITRIPADKIKTEFDEELRLPDQNLIEVIKKLKPNYRIALLSNAGKEEIEIVYRDKIAELFDVIVISYQVGVVKPDPKIFIECIDRLGLKPEECLFIDDIKTYTETAQMLGMKTILYSKFGSIPPGLQSYIIPSA
jgi:glucose-1-phosphatase